jgi:hypothetical protein
MSVMKSVRSMIGKLDKIYANTNERAINVADEVVVF